MHRILYLGIDPSRYVHQGSLVHCPIIQTVPRACDEILSIWPNITHVLFTSPSAVRHWPLPLAGKKLLAIGAVTAQAIKEPSLIAPIATQEGVIALLQTLDLGYLLWPRSTKSRSTIADYLTAQKIRFHLFDLYETETLRPDPLPNLDSFDEIVFTSPSTVHAFLELYGFFPTRKKLTPIGPITAKEIDRFR
jgi:uroporphyrinogen-III synthase